MTFRDNNPGIVEFKEVDQSVTGVLIAVQPHIGPNDSMLYTLSVDEKPMSIWGSVLLDQRMIGVKIGDTIRITYKGLGEKKAGHNAPKIFKVEIDDVEYKDIKEIIPKKL